MGLDIPGCQEFVDSSVRAVSDMALAFVGEPDHRVRAHLDQTLAKSLKRDLAETLGRERAASYAEALIKAVIVQKHAFEAKGKGAA